MGMEGNGVRTVPLYWRWNYEKNIYHWNSAGIGIFYNSVGYGKRKMQISRRVQYRQKQKDRNR